MRSVDNTVTWLDFINFISFIISIPPSPVPFDHSFLVLSFLVNFLRFSEQGLLGHVQSHMKRRLQPHYASTNQLVRT